MKISIPKEKKPLAPIEIQREAEHIRLELERKDRARVSDVFLSRCEFEDCVRLLELLPFPVTINTPHCRGEPFFLTRANKTAYNAAHSLYARCFGDFELFFDDQPVSFGRRQTKELFAYLIDRRGAFVTAEEIAAILWEDENDLPALKHRIRNLVCDMKATLTALGCAGAMKRKRDRVGLILSDIDCDFYRFLDGTSRPQEVFRGEYMEQFSWAESTKAALIFQHSMDGCV